MQDTHVQVLERPECACEVLGEHRRRQAVVAVVGERERRLGVRCAAHGQDRAEQLLSPHVESGTGQFEHSGRDVESGREFTVLVRSLPAQRPRTLPDGHVDPCPDRRPGCGIDHRTHVDLLVQGIAHGPLSDPRNEFTEELVGDIVGDDQP